MDKSDTHFKVQKNGIEGWLHKTTWKRIGEHSNKEGWVLIPTEPNEVLAIREKKANQTQGTVQDLYSQNEAAVAVKSEPFNPEGEIKQLKQRGRPKKLNEDKE